MYADSSTLGHIGSEIMGISTIQIAIIAAFGLVLVFAIVMLVISAVFAKRHRDPDVDPLVGYNTPGAPAATPAQAQPVQYVQQAAPAQPARPYYGVPALLDDSPEPDRSQPETYSDQTKYVLSDENPIPANSRPLNERQGNWDNYDGEYVGYYYDPLEGCYFKGKAPTYVQKTYLPAPPPPVVKRVMPPCAPITSKPKAARPALTMKEGFDIAKIYGQTASTSSAARTASISSPCIPTRAICSTQATTTPPSSTARTQSSVSRSMCLPVRSQSKARKAAITSSW